MREIKFRAWDRETEEFVYSDRTYDHSWFEFQEDSPLKAFATRETGGSLHEPPEPTVGEIEECQMFTGLKDKYGKEIYEGDLWQRDTTLCLVEFKFAAWHLSYLKGPVQYPYSHSCAHKGEVIGNIYENPELVTNLPAKKD